MKRRKFVLARPLAAADFRGSPWTEAAKERWRQDYPLRFFAGFNAAGRVITRHDVTGGVWFFYESPHLVRHAELLAEKGFRVKEILVVDAERAQPGRIDG